MATESKADGDALSCVITSYRFSDGGDGPTYYRMEVKNGGDGTEWITFRRFREFCALDETLRHSEGVSDAFAGKLPPKRWSNKSATVLEERRRVLTEYLSQAVACPVVASHPSFKAFIAHSPCPGDPVDPVPVKVTDPVADLKAVLEAQLAEGKTVEAADTRLEMAAALRVAGKFEDAEACVTEAMSLFSSTSGPESADVARALVSMGNLYMAQRRLDAAKEQYERAVGMQEALGELVARADTQTNLGTLAEAQNKPAEAEELYKAALTVQRSELGEHNSTAATLSNLGLLYVSLRKYEEAKSALGESVTILNRLCATASSGDNTPARNLATALNNLGQLHKKLREMESAETVFRKAADATEQAFGRSAPETAAALNNLASLMKKLEKYEEAEAMYQRALDIRRSLFGEQNAVVANTHFNLGLLQEKMNHLRDAQGSFSTALRLYRDLHMAKSVDSATKYLSQVKNKRDVLEKPATHLLHTK